MDYPISMTVTVVALAEGKAAHAWVSVGQADPSPIRISVEFPLHELDTPENLQDFARQALAAVCESV